MKPREYYLTQAYNGDDLAWVTVIEKQAYDELMQQAEKLTEALKYYSIDPSLLHPQNNSQCAAAMNALAEFAEWKKGLE